MEATVVPRAEVREVLDELRAVEDELDGYETTQDAPAVTAEEASRILAHRGTPPLGLAALVLALALGALGCTAGGQLTPTGAALVELLDVAACGALDELLDPGSVHDVIGTACPKSAPLLQGIINAIGSLTVGAGASLALDRRHHPVRQRGRVTAHLRPEWAGRVQSAIDQLERGVLGAAVLAPPASSP